MTAPLLIDYPPPHSFLGILSLLCIIEYITGVSPEKEIKSRELSDPIRVPQDAREKKQKHRTLKKYWKKKERKK